MVERLLDDDAPLVRGAAVWALGRLRPDRVEALRQARLGAEADPEVRAEWQAAPLPEPAGVTSA